MGYGTDFPANEVGGTKNLWGMGEYGLREVWVRREATVTHGMYGTRQSVGLSPSDTATKRLRLDRPTTGLGIVPAAVSILPEVKTKLTISPEEEVKRSLAA
ncbi:hypothetical protein ARMGADRAFT_1093696 [Armillaria gallica]|uniref:Uncharacterized protein n=1 Tax=Armillaria gallica TaxID=47427 RepID=A0A2H3EK15_ARMGA|nr:hypothetical protein ARMGADRAFT_1093696 [Armillaria gallica]